MDERKITIIEGPPPTFQAAADDWAFALVEGPSLSQIAVTEVRALNGPALIERCYRAWRKREPIHLEFRRPDGLVQEVPIVAAHYAQMDEADVLRLWVAVDNPDIQVTYDFVDEATEDIADLLAEDDEDDLEDLDMDSLNDGDSDDAGLVY